MDPTDDYLCCAQHLLGSQRDFREQRSALQETIEDNGHFDYDVSQIPLRV